MRSAFSKRLASASLVAAAMLLFTAQAAHATHFRYGTIASSQNASNPRIITFTITTSWRRSFFIDQGITANNGSTIAASQTGYVFNFGDGTSAGMAFLVTSIDPTNDWFTATTTLTRTYTTSGIFMPYFSQCCRLSVVSGANPNGLQENGDTSWFLWTRVNTGAFNHPPSASVPPIITLAANFADANFQISATDIDDDLLTYRLATPAEMCGQMLGGSTCVAPVTGNVAQPPGLSVDSNGIVHFDTRAPRAAGQTWNAQVVISDATTSTVVDFLIKLITQTSQPPTTYINGSASPFAMSVLPGTTVNFTAIGTDPDAGAMVTLSASGVPAGATFTPTLPSTGAAPRAVAFSWTPIQANAGSAFNFNIITTDNTGLTDFNSASIQVLANLKPVVGCPTSPLVRNIDPITGLADATVSLPIDDADDDAVNVTWQLAAPPFTVFDTDTTPPATNITVALQHAFGLGTYATEFLVTDTISGVVRCPLTVQVNAAPQLITFDDIADQFYGAGPLTLTASATSNEPISFALISGPASLIGDQLTLTGTGTITVQASQAGNSVYAPALSVIQSFVVTAATPTIVVSGGIFAYDGLSHPAAASVAGVGGGLPFTVAYNGSATVPVDAGTYVVEVSFAGDAFHNPASATATIEITTVDPMITVTGGGTFTFDADYHLATATATGVLGEDLGPVTISYNGGALSPGNAGSYAVLASYPGNRNYNAGTASDTIIINKADPVITIAGGGTFTYFDYHTATATATGVIGEDLGPVTITYNGGVISPGAAGSYAVLASYPGSENYNAGTASDTIIINKADPVITITGGGTFTYGDYHTATATATGVFGENLGPVTITYNGGVISPGAVGTYAVLASIAASANYNAGTASATIVINKADPVMAVSGGSFAYDGIAHGSTGSATGVNGENLGPVTITYNGSPSAPVNAGTYAVLATLAETANYSAASASNTIVIVKADPVVSVIGGTFAYDSSAHAAIAFATGVAGASLGPVVITYNGSLAAPVSGGSYTVLASYGGDGNYNPGSASAAIVINAVALTVRADDKSKIAGDANPPLTATFSGLVGTDSFTPAISTTATAGSPVGTYPITVTPFTSPNYSITFVGGTLTVNPARQLCLDYNSSRAHNSGSTIPIRLRLCDMSGNNLSSSSFVLTALNIALAGGGSAPAQDAGNANPGGRFRLQSGGYMFNLQTTGLPSGAHTLNVGVSGDPTTHSVAIVIR